MLAIGIFLIFRILYFLVICLKTKGVVIRLSWERHTVEEIDENGRFITKEMIVAHPICRFIDQRTGKEFTVRGSVGSDPPSYKVGQEVKILYDLENPRNASIKSFMEIWGVTLILTVLGIPFLLIGLICWYTLT